MGTKRRGKRQPGTRPSDPGTLEPAPVPSNWRRVAALALVLAALTVAVYAGVWSFDFVQLDDPMYVVQNPHIAGGLTWPGLRWAFTTGYAANWHPLTWLSHMLDVTLFGLEPGGAHVVNLLLHVANVLLLFWTLTRLTDAVGRSAFVAALFAVHPAHVESVAWIAERKDVLSTFFWLLTMLAYARYVRRPDWRRSLLLFIVFAIGLMAKPMLVTLPFVLILLDVWPLRRVAGSTASTGSQPWALVREKLPLFALSAASSIATFLAQRSGGAVMSLENLPFPVRIENALLSYVSYLAMLVWPDKLSVYYAHPALLPLWQVAFCIVLLAAVSAIVLAFARLRPYLAVGWLWYLGTLVPVIGLIQVGRQAMADRYTYVPFVGLFIAVAWGAVDLAGRWRAPRWLLPVGAGLVLLSCSAAANRQARYWHDDVSLWTHALQVRLGLDEHRARMAAGDMIDDKTMTALLAVLENQKGNTGPRLDPAGAYQFVGRAFMRHHQLDEAEASFRDAIALKPGAAEFHSDLGLVLSEQGKPDLAVAAYRDALRLDPSLAQTHNDLGFTLAGQGKLADALPHFAEATRLRPDLADAHRNLGLALANLGRMDEAMREFREVLRLKPDDDNVRRVLDEFARRGKSSDRGGGK